MTSIKIHIKSVMKKEISRGAKALIKRGFGPVNKKIRISSLEKCRPSRVLTIFKVKESKCPINMTIDRRKA